MEKEFYAFGTMNYIRIELPAKDIRQEDILNQMEKICIDLDKKLSVFREESEIARINLLAGREKVSASGITWQLLKKAYRVAEVTDGAFDITICPAVKLWNIGHTKNPVIPSKDNCKKMKQMVNFRDVILDEKEHSVYLKKKGQSIDLGGIAKGYAGDLIKEKLIESGVTSALLNFGGNILTIGKKMDGSTWRIGIQNPLRERGCMVGSIPLEDESLVTSGVNERFFIKNGIRYHHLLDPRTCEPAKSGVLSVSAAGKCSMDLDAFTTALFVSGPKKGLALAKENNIEVFYLLENGEILATKEFAIGKYQFTRGE